MKFTMFIKERLPQKELRTYSSHKLNELTSISDIEAYAESLSFNELCYTLSILIGYEIGDLRESDCGFWNDEVGNDFGEETWQEWQTSGRVNERNEVLWYWDEDEMKELLIEKLYELK